MTDLLPGSRERQSSTPALPIDYAAAPRREGASTLSSIAFACSMVFLPGCLAAGLLHPNIPELLLGALMGLPLAGFILGFVAKKKTPGFGKSRWRAKSAIVVGGSELGLVLAIALLLPNLCRSSEQAKRIKCANNLRQIGLALLQYANNHHGQFPPTLASLVSDPGSDITADVLICPSSSDYRPALATSEQQAVAIQSEPGHLSYVYVGTGLSTDKATTATVLAYDNPHNHGDDGIEVLYGDGHVEFLDQKSANLMRAELQSRHNPPRAEGKQN